MSVFWVSKISKSSHLWWRGIVSSQLPLKLRILWVRKQTELRVIGKPKQRCYLYIVLNTLLVHVTNRNYVDCTSSPWVKLSFCDSFPHCFAITFANLLPITEILTKGYPNIVSLLKLTSFCDMWGNSYKVVTPGTKDKALSCRLSPAWILYIVSRLHIKVSIVSRWLRM
jgi:hypothetical protein